MVPKTLTGKAQDGSDVEIWQLWNRRQATKFNGVSYVVQRAAEAVYSAAGQQQTKELVSFYMENARIIRETTDCGWHSGIRRGKCSVMYG